MENNIIIKPNTEIAPQSKKKDILSLYGVPQMLDKITQKEKTNLLNHLNCSMVVVDSLNKIAHSDSFFVEIPKGLREALKTGKATLDKSGKNPGSFTPNIRVKGQSGIQGQVTISKGNDSQAITQSLSNLAMMGMVQTVLAKIEVIEEKVDDIKKGQKDDRVGNIIGPFKGFMDLYPAFKTQEDLKSAATLAYMEMQKGLSQLHKQIDREYEELEMAPKNGWQVTWNTLKNPFKDDVGKYRNIYADYVYDLQLYNRLILLSDVILYLMGDTSAMHSNHQVMLQYCNDRNDATFRKNMQYLTHSEIPEIVKIDEFNNNISKSLEGILLNGLQIECKKEETKLLNTKQYESTINSEHC